MQSPTPIETTNTKRFQAKRDAILAAAAAAINEQSAKGMTFADVARRVGLNTTSVTYYFKRKEDLAAAAFENTLDRLLDMLAIAGREPTPQARIARYIALNMARLARIERGEETAFAVLSDLRAMEEPIRGRLMAGVGFCGSFTTFSTFSVDIVGMLGKGEMARALSYMAVNNVGGVAAAFTGFTLAKRLIKGG